jgi:hypothetical protein
MQSVLVNETITQAWLSCTFNTLPNIKDYANRLEGLMGNLNLNPIDDLTSSYKNLTLSDSKNLTIIYEIAESCMYFFCC